MIQIYFIFLLLAWNAPADAESEEKKRASTGSHAVTTDPIPLSSDNEDRHRDTSTWDRAPSEWQKGWHDSWPIEYNSNKAEWRGRPYSNNYGQASNDHRTYGNSAANDHPYEGFNRHRGPPEYPYGNFHGFNHNRYPSYPPHDNRYNQYGVYDNYGGYGYYGPRQGQEIYDLHNRGGGYRPKTVYGYPYYRYGKGWSNGQ